MWILKSFEAPSRVQAADPELDIRGCSMFMFFGSERRLAEAAPARSSAVDGMWIGNESCFKADKALTLRPPPSQEIHQ